MLLLSSEPEVLLATKTLSDAFILLMQAGPSNELPIQFCTQTEKRSSVLPLAKTQLCPRDFSVESLTSLWLKSQSLGELCSRLQLSLPWWLMEFALQRKCEGADMVF